MWALSNDVETNPTKSCPVCNSNVPIRKSVRDCGHVFKRQKPSPMKLKEAKRVLSAQKRLIETLSEAMIGKNLIGFQWPRKG